LRQDLDWIREHTRLGELARRWEGRGRFNGASFWALSACDHPTMPPPDEDDRCHCRKAPTCDPLQAALSKSPRDSFFAESLARMLPCA
jgi:hypothetical protein